MVNRHDGSVSRAHRALLPTVPGGRPAVNLLRRARVPAATLTLLALMLAGCGAPAGTEPAAPASRIPASPRVSALTQATSPCSEPGGLLVRSASKLTSALAKARPGETIRLAPGNYDGD